MLATLGQALAFAEERGSAVGAFDTPNLELLIATIRAAEKRDEPVIIQHAQLHEDVTPLSIIGPVMIRCAGDAKVPVCPMIDHATDEDYVRDALQMGFPAIMFDASNASFEDNVAATKSVVDICRAAGAQVEAELGVTEGHAEMETGGEGTAHESLYTDPEQAAAFVAATGIDALAASFGTVHGFYRAQPHLDFERIERTRQLAGVPLVMHGGSGLSREVTRHAISCGIRKINYFSYMSHAGVVGVEKLLEEREVRFFHEIAAAATDAMEADCMSAMETFSMREEAGTA